MKITKPLASCFTYTIGKNLYVPITSRSNAKTLPETRGPGFYLSADTVAALCRVRDEEHGSKQWAPWCMYLDTQTTKQKLPPPMELLSALPQVDNPRLPSIEDLTNEILEECRRRPDYSSIVFAGEGEPTLRLNDVVRIAVNLKESGVEMLPPLRLTTNGLIQSPESVVKQLKDANILSLSVSLMTADPHQYDELMTPVIPDGHETVCILIQVATTTGLDVEITCVDRPDVDKSMAENLARVLNVSEPIRWRVFFP